VEETTSAGDGYILEEEEQKYTPPESETLAHNTTSEFALGTEGFKNLFPGDSHSGVGPPAWQLNSM